LNHFNIFVGAEFAIALALNHVRAEISTSSRDSGATARVVPTKNMIFWRKNSSTKSGSAATVTLPANHHHH
jgi:hypothetical protein